MKLKVTAKNKGLERTIRKDGMRGEKKTHADEYFCDCLLITA